MLNEVLRQEEVLWYQKSCVAWQKCGDMNTKIFHTSTITRHRINKIKGLLNDVHQWEFDQENLRALTVIKFL